MNIGHKVRFRGKYAREFSIRGTIEVIEGALYGVRLENGNYALADHSQLQEMTTFRLPCVPGCAAVEFPGGEMPNNDPPSDRAALARQF